MALAKARQATSDPLLSLALRRLPDSYSQSLGDQSTIPAIAKDPVAVAAIRECVAQVDTRHRLMQGDARDMAFIRDEAVHLIVTSPPYWTLKKYNDSEHQLGAVADYEEFTSQLSLVWQEALRVLVPGGRLVIVVGDVCLSRRKYGRHVVAPLHATIQESCRRIGFDNLAPIIWYKIANANYEAGGGGFLGKPYEPNAIIKNDIEYVLIQRKPGGYRAPTLGMRILSVIADAEHKAWFQQIWQLPGASTKEHPAPFPLALADHLVRMFSFVGDTVLDPFVGTGTTMIACSAAGRNSMGIETDGEYVALAERRFLNEAKGLFSRASLEVQYTQ
jgi:DNA modification methylase